MNEPLIQGIGFAGLTLFVMSYQIKSNRALFFCQMLGCIIFSLQFFLMGAYTGAVSLIVNIVRNVLLLNSDRRPWAGSRAAMFAVLLALLVLTAFTWDGVSSLLSFVSFTVTTLGYWTRNARKIRLSQLIGSPCMLFYDLIVRSWGGALSEGISILSILISIRRFGWRNLAELK